MRQNIANAFLISYLREMEQDHVDAWPLLRYYMTEKAMVCAYVSILYDGQPDLGAEIPEYCRYTCTPTWQAARVFYRINGLSLSQSR